MLESQKQLSQFVEGFSTSPAVRAAIESQQNAAKPAKYLADSPAFRVARNITASVRRRQKSHAAALTQGREFDKTTADTAGPWTILNALPDQHPPDPVRADTQPQTIGICHSHAAETTRGNHNRYQVVPPPLHSTQTSATIPVQHRRVASDPDKRDLDGAAPA